MIERLNLYDILSGVVPGAILVSVLSALFPHLKGTFIAAGLPSEFALVALVAGSIVAGQVIQSLGSLGEPLLFRIFGGRPSDLALGGSLPARYLPKDASVRIAAKLRTRCDQADASPHGLFLYAMNTAESTADSKARTFNAQYGHLRALATLGVLVIVMLVTSRYVGDARAWKPGGYWTVVGVTVSSLMLFAWRAWQRGAYYAREVLLAAERLIDATGSSPSSKAPPTQ
jgi:hypothetical protein